MAIFKGSRYRLSDTIQTEDADRNVESVYVLRDTTVTPPEGSQPYTTKAGDTFEKIAYKRYGDGNKWYVLADMNPQVFFPLNLEPGTLIYLPPRTVVATS
jgi:nucleoid-associated protein YgaU